MTDQIEQATDEQNREKLAEKDRRIAELEAQVRALEAFKVSALKSCRWGSGNCIAITAQNPPLPVGTSASSAGITSNRTGPYEAYYPLDDAEAREAEQIRQSTERTGGAECF